MHPMQLQPNSTDNWETPSIAWTNIKDLIPKDKVIWEPFYLNGSSGKFLKDLTKQEVIHEKDVDFFDRQAPDNCFIVTNPPFSKKQLVLKRVKELNIPFIMIMPLDTISNKYFIEMFPDIQIRIPLKKIKFLNKKTEKHVTFACAYFCSGLNLKKDLDFIK